MQLYFNLSVVKINKWIIKSPLCLTLTAPPWGSYFPSPWIQTWRSSRSSCFTMLGCRWVQFAVPQQLSVVYIRVGLLLQRVNQADHKKTLCWRRLCLNSKRQKCVDWCSKWRIYTNLHAAVKRVILVSETYDSSTTWKMHVTGVVGLCCRRHDADQKVKTIESGSSWTYCVVGLWFLFFYYLNVKVWRLKKLESPQSGGPLPCVADWALLIKWCQVNYLFTWSGNCHCARCRFSCWCQALRHVR